MKCNVRELAHISHQPCIIEGRLNYKKVSHGSYRTVFKEKWFRLINNYLFYFKISEMGKFDTSNPAGVFIMENSSIQMEHGQSIPFSFSISFIDEPEKRHILAARSEDSVVQWVMKLRECSYEYLRNRLHVLQSKIYSITGKDPLLLVPRNEGACLWAPSAPFSAVPACSVNGSTFSCHLHTNGLFTLERSKSDVQTNKHLRAKYRNNTKFYTDDNVPITSHANGTPQGFCLERSMTSLASGVLQKTSIFDNEKPYNRVAPSPPVRKKQSPQIKRAQLTSEVDSLTKESKNLVVTGILDLAPIPPRRKISPKPELYNPVPNTDANTSKNDDSTEDLIKF